MLLWLLFRTLEPEIFLDDHVLSRNSKELLRMIDDNFRVKILTGIQVKVDSVLQGKGVETNM